MRRRVDCLWISEIWVLDRELERFVDGRLDRTGRQFDEVALQVHSVEFSEDFFTACEFVSVVTGLVLTQVAIDTSSSSDRVQKTA